VTAGLPGAGIGGIFYLLAALLAPAWEAVRALRDDGSPRRWRLVLRHFLLAVFILSGIWLTGWLIGVVLTSPSIVGQRLGASVDPAYTQMIGRRMAMFTLTTLAVVLIAVEVLRLLRVVLRRWRRRTVLPMRRRLPTPIPAPRIVPADDAA